MKKTTIIASVLLAIAFRLYSQGIEIILDEKNPQTYTEIIDSLFQNIDHRKTSTGIFYDRVFPFAGLHRFNKEKPDTSNYSHFIQAYSEINRAYTSRSELPMGVSELRRAIDRKLNAEESIVPVGLFAYRFNIIDSLAFDKGNLKRENGKIVPYASDHAELFTTSDVLVASPLIKTFSGNSITFMISPRWLFSNMSDKIRNLEIDFDDGSGFRKFNISVEQTVNVSYAERGEKVLAFRIELDKGEVIETKATFILTFNDGVKSNYPDWPFDPAFVFEACIPFTDYSGNTFRGKGEETYIYSNANKILQKPIIIVDGFDPGDKRNDFGTDNVNGEPRESIWELFNAETYNMADQLMYQGYDIVILNFPEYINQHSVLIDGGADFIERNAFVLVELVNRVNQTLTLNGSEEELVIIGPSMGGQISRYALAYMEQNNMDHNTRLWVSFDSPHPSIDLSLGANINYGAQSFLRFFGETGEQEAALDNWENTVCSNAAKQMLVRHRLQFLSSPQYHAYHQIFSNNMEQIGFPENLRKVSIVNGSLNGTLNNLSCQKAYEMELKLGLVRLTHAKIYQQPGFGNSCQVFEASITKPDWTFYVREKISIGSNDNTCSYDIAPGGTYDTYLQIEDNASGGDVPLTINNAILESHSFISTKSALAFTGNNQNLAENMITRNLVNTGETPFDSYWGPINKNMGHIEFDADLMCWVLNEINGIPMPPSITSTITGPTTVCSSWVTYTLNNVPEGLTVSWDVSSNLTTSTSCTPAPGTACIRVRASGVFNGSGFVRATVSGPCGDVMVPSYPVWVGTVTPLTGIIGFPYNGMEFGSNTVYNFSVYPPPAQGVTYTEWNVGGGTITQGQGSQQVSVLTGTGSDETPLYFNVNVRVGNSCGLSPWFMRTGYVVGGTGAITSFSVYPNPTTGMVTIAALEDETNALTASNHTNEIHSVKIFDKMGMAVGSFNFSGQDSQVNVNVSSLPKGVYLILINEKDRLTLIKE